MKSYQNPQPQAVERANKKQIKTNKHTLVKPQKNKNGSEVETKK